MAAGADPATHTQITAVKPSTTAARNPVRQRRGAPWMPGSDMAVSLSSNLAGFTHVRSVSARIWPRTQRRGRPASLRVKAVGLVDDWVATRASDSGSQDN